MLLVLWLRLAIGSIVHNLFQLVGVGGADEVALHIVDVAIGVHQVLLVLSLDLDSSHYHVVLYVHALFLFLSVIVASVDALNHLLPADLESPIAALNELGLLIEEVHVLIVVVQEIWVIGLEL